MLVAMKRMHRGEVKVMLYLDHAASTPIDPEIRVGLMQRFETHYANPSSAHGSGRLAPAAGHMAGKGPESSGS